MQIDLTGKKALVTGASRGLGRAIALSLARAGADVVITYEKSADKAQAVTEEIKALGRHSEAIQADSASAQAIQDAVTHAARSLGGLDILVNGAGLQYRCPSEEFPEDAWDRIMGVNIKGVFFMSQLAGKVMLKQGKGKIINIASTNSFIGLRNMPAYVSSKGGVKQLTMALSSEWSGRGINVNAIAPGYMDTEMSKDLQQMEQGKQLTKRIPMGRWGHPEDLMGTVVFLASSASDYISGVTLPVDGGHLAS